MLASRVYEQQALGEERVPVGPGGQGCGRRVGGGWRRRVGRGAGKGGREGRGSLASEPQLSSEARKAPPSGAQRATCPVTAETQKEKIHSQLGLPLVPCIAGTCTWASCCRQGHPAITAPKSISRAPSPRFNRQSCHCNNEEPLTVITLTILKDVYELLCRKRQEFPLTKSWGI